MFNSPRSLEILSVTQILLNLGDEAMTGSLQINDQSPIWIDGGNLVMAAPWVNIKTLIPLLLTNSGSILFNETEEIPETLEDCPQKALDWCVLEVLRSFDQEWNQKEYGNKLPDADTKLRTTDDFRGTIEFNRIEQKIYDRLESEEASCESLAKELDLDIRTTRIVVCRLSLIGLIEEIYQMETIASIRKAQKTPSSIPLPEPVKNQVRMGLPIVALVFLWLFNAFGKSELKLISLLQQLFSQQETLNNIVLLELEESELAQLPQAVAIIDSANPSIVGAILPNPDTNLQGIDYWGVADQASATSNDKLLTIPRIVDVDGVERRGLLAEEFNDEFTYSFGTKLALTRLKQVGVSPKWHETDKIFSLSGTTISPIEYGNSLYPRDDINGYQILLKPPSQLETLSLKDITDPELQPDKLAHKIVAIGLKSDDKNKVSDLHFQTNIANQILLSGTYGRKPIAVASRWYSIILALLLWCLVLQISLKINQTPNKYLKLSLLATTILLTHAGLTLLAFVSGNWYSLSYSATAAIIGIVSAFGYKPAMLNSYIDQESNLLSNKGFFDTMRKLLDIQFDKVEDSTLYIIGIENYQYLIETINPKQILGEILNNISQLLEHFEVEDYTIGRLNLNRIGLLIPCLTYESSKQLKVQLNQAFAKLTNQFKGISPRITIGMAIFDGENYISPIELVASADSDSLS